MWPYYFQPAQSLPDFHIIASHPIIYADTHFLTHKL